MGVGENDGSFYLLLSLYTEKQKPHTNLLLFPMEMDKYTGIWGGVVFGYLHCGKEFRVKVDFGLLG